MINIGIIGVSGYTGLELVKILLNHSTFKIAYLANTSGGAKLWEIHPSLVNVSENLHICKFDINDLSDIELVFLALPHETSMEITPKILDKGIKVVDLSADYRLSEANYNKTYTKHKDSANLKNAVYGLVEWNREQIKNAKLIANPGCYPTASLLGILPFVEYIDGKSVFIDAKSGVSGAGKKLTDSTHFPAINDNIFSYSPLKHRHSIEINEKCQLFGKRNLSINFVPHLSPFTRGMLTSIFTRLQDSLNPLEILHKAYDNEPFIRIRESPVDVKSVSGTHFCDIFAMTNGCDLYVNTSIDNLLRGASSQAVACANLMCGLSEDIAMPKITYAP